MKYLKGIFVFLFVMTSLGYCDSKSFVENLGDRAIQTLTNSDDSLSTIEDKFLVLLDEGFDIPHISAFVMGRYWRLASESQQKRFMNIFRNRLKKAYASRFREHRGVKFAVGGVINKNGADYVASTIQKPGGPKTDVEWRVQNDKIQDVKVDGISMSVTLRDDYNSFLAQKNGDIEIFLVEMEKKG